MREYQETLGVRRMEQRLGYLYAPHPAEEINIDFTCLEDVDLSTALEHRLEGPNIFNEGRRIDSRMEALLSYWQNGSY